MLSAAHSARRETEFHRGIAFISLTRLPEEGKSFLRRRSLVALPLLLDGLPGGMVSLRTSTDPQAPHHYSRAGALKAFGNAIVPQLAAEVIGAFLDTDRDRANG